jgi:hypothetical protein
MALTERESKIITPKQPKDERTVSGLSKLVPYMLRGKGEERCTWHRAGNRRTSINR